MGVLRPFGDFDLKAGPLPDYPFSQMWEIVWRARELLLNRSKDDILGISIANQDIVDDYSWEQLDRFIDDQINDDGWAKDQILTAKKEGENLRAFVEFKLPELARLDRELDYFDREDIRVVDALKARIDVFGFPSLHKMDVKQHEGFAVLALSLVEDCLRRSVVTPEKASTSRPSHTDFDYSLAGDYALQAMDAVCYAERLEEARWLKDRLNDRTATQEQLARELAKRREGARKGGLATNKENIALKQFAFEYYETHEDEFKDKNNEEAGEHLTKIVAVKHRTAVGWISALRKRQSAG